jgi:pectate lyase
MSEINLNIVLIIKKEVLMFKLFSSYILIILVIIAVSPCLGGQEDRIFKGAIGFGIDTMAGNYGRVIKVTNLNASGPGSFVEALHSKGPRLVVFEVGGVIDLGLKKISITEPYLTVAGQTAPSPGITLIKGGLQIRTHDILFRHIRIRPGDGEKVKVPWSVDGMTTIGRDAYNVIVDHCSFSWGIDECLSVSGARNGTLSSHKVTLSNNIIAETLYDSIHPKKCPHSRATAINDFCRDIAVIRNIYAHNNRRHPIFKPETTGVIVNNLIYDPGLWCITSHGSRDKISDPDVEVGPPRWSIVGNHVIPGPSTKIDAIFYSWLEESVDPAEVYFHNNVCDDKDVLQTKGRVKLLDTMPVWPENMAVIPAENVYEELLTHAGARPADRDEVDIRIIKEIRKRTGGLIDSQDDVGGYPDPEPVSRLLNVPSSPQERIKWLNKLARRVEAIPQKATSDELEPLEHYSGRLQLIYENNFSDILDIDDWLVEGPGRKYYWEQKMTLIPDAQQAVYKMWEKQGRRVLDPDKEHRPNIGKAIASIRPLMLDDITRNGKVKGGHIVCWNKAFETGSDYIVTYDFKPLSPIGLGIIFFSAKGINGEDVLSDKLSPRYGIFSSYVKGDIDCYHISYWANNAAVGKRGTCNLRKNSGFYCLTNGEDPSVRDHYYSEKKFDFKTHNIVLIKDGKDIRFYIDREIAISYTDKRFNDILTADGKLDKKNVDTGEVLQGGRIGLRQMVGLIGQYDNFKVYKIEKQ